TAAPTRAEAYRLAAGWLGGQLASRTPSLTGAAFYAGLVDLHTRGGDEAMAAVPPEWWAELGAIGTLEDAAAHIDALERAGATGVALVPAPDAEGATRQIDDVLELARR